MAKKLIVFAAIAALVQASSSSSSASASDLQSARLETLTKWWLAATAFYDTVQDPSSSLRDAGDKHRSYLLDGAHAFLAAAVRSDQLDTLRNVSLGLFVPLSDYLFKGISVGRKCKDWSKTEAAIDKVREQIRENDFIKAYGGLIGLTGSQTPACESSRDIYDAQFHAIKALAAYKCGRESRIKKDCAVYTAVKDFVDIIYGQLSDGHQ